MKVSKPLILLLVSFNLLAQDNVTLKLDEYLSSYKKEEFAFDYSKNQQESLKLRDSWIAPLQLNYRYSKSNPYDNTQTNKTASVTMNQPIFRSGGIIYGIKFATASKKYNDYAIDVQKRKLIKEAISLLMQIKQTQLQIQKQEKQVENSQIKLDQNKQEYLSGELDSGFLDNAVIQLNLVKQTLFNLQSTKEKLISQFRSISDKNYKEAYIPVLKNISKKDFLRHNIVLKMYESEKEKNSYRKNVVIAQYLPSLNISASYTRDEVTNPSFAGTPVQSPEPTNYYSYGFNISMPIDFNTYRDIQSAKIDQLKSNVMIEDKKRELVSLYEQVEENIQTIQKKITLARENYDIYKKLLDDTKQLYKAGYKAKMDVDLLQNSADMAQLDVMIYTLDKQLELLNLYEYYYEVQ